MKIYLLLSTLLSYVSSFKMHTNDPTPPQTKRPSVSPRHVPSAQSSIAVSHSPPEDYFTHNDDAYALLHDHSFLDYYPFNLTNSTINSTFSNVPTASPTMRFYSIANETFNQTYTGVGLVGLTRRQIRGFERFMASLTPLYIATDAGRPTEGSCDLTSQVLSDISRRFLLQVNEDEEIVSDFTRLLQVTGGDYYDDDYYYEDYTPPPTRLDIVFDLSWMSLDQYLNETEYVTNFVEFMNSENGRNLTLAALQNLSLPIDTVGNVEVWVDPTLDILDIEVATKDVPTWDVLKTTGIFTLVTTAFFLVVFEFGRRNKMLRSVFDQRRAKQPFRTPSPLRKRWFEWLLFLTPSRYLFQDKMSLGDYLVQIEEPLYSSSLDEGNECSDSSFSSSSSGQHQKNDSTRSKSCEPLNGTYRPIQEKTKKFEINQHVINDDKTPVMVNLPLSNNISSASEMEKAPSKVVEDDNLVAKKSSSMSSNPLDLVQQSQFPSDKEKSCSKKRPTTRAVRSKTSMLSRFKSKKHTKGKYQVDKQLENRVYKVMELIANACVDSGDSNLENILLVEAIGLDAFVMLRYIRFGFHVTFLPFIIACIALIPFYYTNDYETNTGTSNIFATGYFAFTLNRLEQGSPRFWICWAFAILYRFYTLFRLWKEWELFTPFRFEFFKKGDPFMELELIMPEGLQKDIINPFITAATLAEENEKGTDYVNTESTSKHDDLSSTSPQAEGIKVTTNLNTSEVDVDGKPILVIPKERERYLRHNQVKQLRNSCLIEYIPPEYRTNKKLYSFYNLLFPDQIMRVKMFAKNPKLDECIAKRQNMIEKYERLFAKHYCAQQIYRDSTKRRKGSMPKEPTIKVFKDSYWYRTRVEALPYYLEQIEELNKEAEEEWGKIFIEEELDDGRSFPSKRRGTIFVSATNLLSSIYKRRTYASGTAVVEFKSLAAAQSATQSTITGKTNYMTIVNAPDPREIIWENATVYRGVIDFRKFISTILLISGLAVWAPFVALITSLTDIDNYKSYFPSEWIPPAGTPMYNFIKGYFPVLVLEVVMAYLPVLLGFIATRLVRVKTESESDNFILFWNSVYRTWNIFIVIVSGSIVSILDAIAEDPQQVFSLITQGIFFSSQFFFDNVIFATGTGLFYELCQLPSVLSYFIKRKCMNENASSQRELEKLEEGSRFDWGDCLPEFLFIFMVAQLYCTNVPILLGVCSVFFFLAYKVFLHQAFYIYSPHYESGGSFMYYMSNATFLMMHISNFTLFGMFALKDAGMQASSYLGISLIATVLVKRAIHTKFIVPSQRIALTNARMIDEKNKTQEAIWKKRELKKRQIARSENFGNISMTGNILDYDHITQKSWYMYQQPQFNRENWETKPRPYRKKCDILLSNINF